MFSDPIGTNLAQDNDKAIKQIKLLSVNGLLDVRFYTLVIGQLVQYDGSRKSIPRFRA